MAASTLQISYLIFGLNRFNERRKNTALLCTVWLGMIAIPSNLFLFAIFTLCSFDDFSDLKNVIAPLLTSGIISLIGIVLYCIKNMPDRLHTSKLAT